MARFVLFENFFNEMKLTLLRLNIFTYFLGLEFVTVSASSVALLLSGRVQKISDFFAVQFVVTMFNFHLTFFSHQYFNNNFS